MSNKTDFDSMVKLAVEGDSPEAREVRDIMIRMIESETNWVKTHTHEDPCPRRVQLGIKPKQV